MANWQDSRQQEWNPDGPPITDPPKKILMTPDESAIPLTRTGVLYGQSGLSAQSEVPIQVQPGSYLLPNINCPPGLEHLLNLDSLMVDLRLALCEGNKYDVKDPQGRIIYTVARDVDCSDICCCNDERLYDLQIFDEAEREVIHIHRLIECCTFKLPELEISSNGVILGSVIQNWHAFHTSYSIRDASGDIVLSVERPGCTCDFNFYVVASDGEHKIGRITRKTTLKTGQIDVSFPRDLDVKLKAVLLSTWFLINVLAKS